MESEVDALRAQMDEREAEYVREQAVMSERLAAAERVLEQFRKLVKSDKGLYTRNDFAAGFNAWDDAKELSEMRLAGDSDARLVTRIAMHAFNDVIDDYFDCSILLASDAVTEVEKVIALWDYDASLTFKIQAMKE